MSDFTPTITIDMGKDCAECWKPGATGSGICIKCAGKAYNLKRPMKSAEGRAVQERVRNLHPRQKP